MSRRPGRKIPAGAGGLKVIESFDKATGAYQVRPARARRLSSTPDAYLRIGLSVHHEIWRDLAAPAKPTPFGGPLLFDLGERWHYSTSTDVVGKLVEVVSGQKLEDYFRQHILPRSRWTILPTMCRGKGAASVAQQQRRRAHDGAVESAKPQLATIAAPTAAARHRPPMTTGVCSHVPQRRHA